MLTPAGIVGVTAGVIFAATGALLLAARPARRGLSAFAAYAILTGTQLVIGYVGQDAAIALLLGWSFPLMGMAGIAIVVAVTSYTRRAAWPILPFVLAAATGAWLVLRDGSSMLFPTGDPTDLAVIFWQMPVFVAGAFAIVLLARHAARAPSSELRTETLLLLTALAPHLGYTSAISLLVALTTPGALGEPWWIAYTVTFTSALAATAYVVAALARERSRPAILLAILIGGATLAGFAQFTLTQRFLLFGGLLRIAAAVLLGYGLLKYRLFDVDLKVKWTLDRGSLLAVFGGVFFLVEEFAANFVQDALGFAAGLAAAALLLFALKPLRAWSAALADRVFPHVHASDEYVDARRVVVYRTAAEAAAKDGIVTERERAMLDALVRELGLSSAEVDRVERAILSSARAG